MSNIEFEEDTYNNPRQFRSGIVPGATPKIGMVNWLVSHGIIRSDSGAKAVLIGFIVVNFTITALVMYFYVLR